MSRCDIYLKGSDFQKCFINQTIKLKNVFGKYAIYKTTKTGHAYRMDRIPELKTYPSWSRFAAPRPVVRCFPSIRISARIKTRTLHNKQNFFFARTTRSLHPVDANSPITTATNFSRQNFLIILYGPVVVDFDVINLSIVYGPSLSVFQTHVCNACCAMIDHHCGGRCIGSTTSVWKTKR